MPHDIAIDIRGLSKCFNGAVAVDNVTFTVRLGEVFGFMGHNGAGKTTTLRMLLGLLRPTKGSASVLGHDIVKDSLAVRRVTGFLPGDYALPRRDDRPPVPALRGGDVWSIGGLRSRWRIEQLLGQFELSDVADHRLRTFSSGMTQKVGLAQALLNAPRVLLLDEPTAGLDPIGRRDTLELIRKLARDDGVTVLFSTHILNDIERVCERAAILHHGRLIADGNLKELKLRYGVQQMDDLYLTLVEAAA